MILAFLIASDRHTESSRKRGGSVPGAKRVVFRLVAPQETTDAAILFDGWQFRATSRKDLVSVSLVTHVPNQTVPRRIERIMQSDGEFDGAESGPSVATHSRHGL